MSITADIAGGILLSGACLEICARLFYAKKFHMPWRSKVIGEYPYDEFVEKAEPPIHFQFRKGYRSRHVNINSLGMRCAEPDSRIRKKKLLVIGESIFFGAKILNEKSLWCYQLQDILLRNNISDWEIFNAGFPGYNVYQYDAWWEKSLKNLEPDIVILQCGANDITQAYVMGEKWEPGLPWPWDFIMRQQRKTGWWQKLLFHSCLYFMYRRKKLTERKGFESAGNVFRLEECIESLSENAGKIISDAQSMGARVLLSSFAMAYDPDSIEKNPPQLDSIQANWRESLSSTGIPMIEFNNWWINEFSEQVSCPSLNLQEIFQVHPKRYEMYLDVAHWNEAGHKLAAESIFGRLSELNWW